MLLQRTLSQLLSQESAKVVALGSFSDSRGKSALSTIRDSIPEWFQDVLFEALCVSKSEYYLRGLVSLNGSVAFRPFPIDGKTTPLAPEVIFIGTLDFLSIEDSSTIEMIGYPDQSLVDLLAVDGHLRMVTVAMNGHTLVRELQLHCTPQPTARPKKRN